MNPLDLFRLVKEEFTRPSMNYPGICPVIYSLYAGKIISRNDILLLSKAVDEEGNSKEGSYSIAGLYFTKNIGEPCGGYLWKPYEKEPRIEFLDKKIYKYSYLS